MIDDEIKIESLIILKVERLGFINFPTFFT